MLMTAIVLAVIAAVIQTLVGIPEPWNKLIYIGIIILFVVGLFQLLAPGVI